MGRYVLFPPAGSLHHYCFYADHYNITASAVRGFVAAAAAGEREPALTHAAQIRKAWHWPTPRPRPTAAPALYRLPRR